MAATYTSPPATNLDWVRFLTGQTDTATTDITDEEITAVLGEETASGSALKYYAAARVLGILMAGWGTTGQGILEKSVGALKLKYGQDATANAQVEMRMAELRARGSYLLRSSAKAFKVV